MTGPAGLPSPHDDRPAAEAARHWDSTYEGRPPEELSWFQSAPDTSLRLLARSVSRTGAVIDVGAGTSPLAAALIDAAWSDVTVLDVSAAALGVTRDRLGDRASQVSFVTTELLSWQPKRAYDGWHDRAVFHFLVEAPERARYVALTRRAVAPGGALVLGTFAADGPTRCSGLPTARYDPNELAHVFAPGFSLEHAEREEHHTPGGTIQPFSWVVLRATSVASAIRHATEG